MECTLPCKEWKTIGHCNCLRSPYFVDVAQWSNLGCFGIFLALAFGKNFGGQLFDAG